MTLTATVADATNSSTTVGEGSVTFTVEDSSGKQVGNQATGTVKSGAASGTFALPGGEAVGNYKILVSYSDGSAGKFTDNGTDHSGTLAVNSTSVLVKANDTSATFHSADHSLNLTASVTDPNDSNDIVNEGKVQFTVTDSSGKQVGTPVTGEVSNGTASASFTLPTPGSYNIAVSYSDTPADFTDNGTDTPGKLVLSAATTTTIANSATAAFSSSDQNVTLTAAVTSPGGPVNEGSVAFALVDSKGNTIGTATSSAVSNGQASVRYVVPGGTAAGNYVIQASYSDVGGGFDPSADNTQTLTIGAASATTLRLTTVNIVPSLSNSTAQMTLTVQVNNSAGQVDQGDVSIKLAGASGHGNVDHGTASVQLTVPLGTVSNLVTADLSYTDKVASANFSDGSGSATVTTNLLNALLPADLTYDSSGNVKNQLSLGGNTSLLGFSYLASGLLADVLFASLSLPVTYSNLGGNTVTTFLGAPTAVTFANSSGQVLGYAKVFFDGAQLQWLIYDPSNHPIGEVPYTGSL